MCVWAPRPSFANPFVPVASYRLLARFNPEAHCVLASGSITFTNTSAATVGELWFHLYPNAFSNENTRFLRGNNTLRRSKRSQLFRPGNLEILKLTLDDVNGKDIWANSDATTPGDPNDTTDRRVPLPEPLKPNQTLVLYVQFVTNLPFIVERMGWVEDFHAFTQWFPKLAQLEPDGTWRHFPYEPLAEFSADFGNYDITVDTPENYTVAAPGDCTSDKSSAGRSSTHCRLQAVHDFAFFVATRFVVSGRDTHGIRVQVFAPPGHQRNAVEELDTLEFGLEHYQRLFGPYPYRRLVVVHPPDVAAPAGGMEYPGLIVTGGPWYLPWSGFRSIAGVTLHELAHQWFYGIIANDEARFPVLDEGLATWAELEGLTQMFGQGSAYSGFGVTVSATAIADVIGTTQSDKLALARPATEFPTFSAMAATIYARTGALLNTLANVYGTDKLQRALHQYAGLERFSHPTPDALIGAVETEMGAAAAQNLKTAMYSSGWVDYSVGHLSSRKMSTGQWHTDVTLLRTGTLQFPVRLSLSLHNGQVLNRTWNAEKQQDCLDFITYAPVDSVAIDPESKIEIETSRMNNAIWRQSAPWPITLLDRLTFLLQWLLGAALP
jgi:hypothetical protein